MSHTRFGLNAPARFVQEIRKSKFVANASNVASEAAALEFLALISDQGATHNCWAWRIGQRYRFSDDGEPAGTAGKPILQAIDGQSVDNVIVVVTRWFGGIKLGAGGLMRAYGGCAAECLRQAGKTELIETVRVEFALEFAVLARLRARLREIGGVLEAEEFRDDGALLRLRLPQAKLPELRNFLGDLSRGRAELLILD
jgi:uncharacterized YigZ family protein